MSSNESTLNIMDKTKNKMKTPTYSIDRGWSWVVLSSVTFCIMVLGLVYVIGIFNVIFLEVFGESRQLTAWISVPQTSLIALATPLSGLLEKYLGSRLTMIVGGLLGATGFFLSYFATSFLFVFLTFGIIVGTAHGIVYMQCALSVAKYFKKYRNLAFGVLGSGFGLSSLVLPSIINETNDTYGWRGCMLIMSGIYLQIVVCGSLIRSQPILPDEEPQLELDINPIQISDNQKSQEFHVESSSKPITNVSAEVPEIAENEDRSTSFEQCQGSAGSLICKTGHDYIACENCQKQKKQEHSRVMKIDDGVPSVKFEVDSPVVKRAEEAVPLVQCEVDTQGDKNKLNLMHVVDGRVIIMIFNVFCFNAGTFMAFVHFPDYFKQFGTSEKEMSLIYTMIGACSFICRLLMGAATSSSDISALIVYTAGSGVGAVFLLLCPLLAPHYWGQIIFGMGFSFYGSIFHVLSAPVTVDVFGINKLSHIFTLILVSCGIASICGPPFAGWLFDITEDYELVFIITGVIYMAGALSTMIIPLIKETDVSKAT